MTKKNDDTSAIECIECSRRTALKLGAGFAVGLTTGASLPACGPLETLDGNVVINLSDYPGLMTMGAPVSIDEDVSGFNHPIFLINEGPDGFRALSAECPHLSCDVEPIDGVFVCPCHDSEFDFVGTVLTGPAREDLRSFETTVEGDVLTILAPPMEE